MRDLRKLPKAHLHLHLEGSMRRSTLEELCASNRIDCPDDTRGKRFESFAGFNALYRAACECLRTRDDLARLIREVAQDAAAQGVRWIEPAFDAERYAETRAGQPHRLFESQAEGWQFALAAAEAASRATGVGIGYMSAVDRSRPVAQGIERGRVTAGLVRAGRHLVRSRIEGSDGAHPGIVAFGLHGNEEGFPPAPFEPAFRIALEGTGLLSTPHAGEIAPAPGEGPASVASALEQLGAHRILHGVLAAEDPALVARLARSGVCLDVCPSSNVALGVSPSIGAHPLPALLAAGVACDVGADDPLLFGPSLLDELELCRSAMGLDDGALAGLARNSFTHSGAPAGVKSAGIAAIDAWLEDSPREDAGS